MLFIIVALFLQYFIAIGALVTGDIYTRLGLFIPFGWIVLLFMGFFSLLSLARKEFKKAWDNG